MRTLNRVLATTVAGLALTTGAVVTAGPAAAAGEGCIGLPSVPAAFVCVVSLTPANAVPTVTSTNIPVTVPEVCYYVACSGPTTVQVPLPGATPNSGYVAVIRHNNVDYPIGLGSVGSAYQAVLGIGQQALVLANAGVALVIDTYGTVSQIANEWVQYVQDNVPPVPTVSQIRNTVYGIRDTYITPVTDPWVAYAVATVNDTINNSPTVDDVVYAANRAWYQRCNSANVTLRKYDVSLDCGYLVG
jgi:hypothetical protein